jgi:hypothetical protein
MTPPLPDNRPEDYELPIQVHPPVELDFTGGLTTDQRSWPVGGFERVERPIPEATLDFAESVRDGLVVSVQPPEGPPLNPRDMAELTDALDTLRQKGYRVERVGQTT